MDVEYRLKFTFSVSSFFKHESAQECASGGNDWIDVGWYNREELVGTIAR